MDSSDDVQNDRLFNSIRRSLNQLITDDRKDEAYFKQFFVNPLTCKVLKGIKIEDPSSMFNMKKTIDIEPRREELCIEPEWMEPVREKHELFEEFAIIYGFSPKLDRLPKYQSQKPLLKPRERATSEPAREASPPAPKFCHICFEKKLNLCTENGEELPDLGDLDAPWNNHRAEENGKISCPQWFFYGYPDCVVPRENAHE